MNPTTRCQADSSWLLRDYTGRLRLGVGWLGRRCEPSPSMEGWGGVPTIATEAFVNGRGGEPACQERVEA